jgi:hypothetical protein
MLHPIREIAHFMNWPNFCPLHELASTLAHFTNWAKNIKSPATYPQTQHTNLPNS